MVPNEQGWVHRKLKLSHWRHSGRRLPREQTSHGALLVITIAAGIMLAVATRSLMVNAQSITVGAIVPGAPPSQAALIQSPTDGQVFTSSPVDVSGTCQTNDFVEIYKNGILGGSTTCVGGQFGVPVDLIDGANALKARTVDTLNQYGPDSAIVNVTYNPPAPPAGVTTTPTGSSTATSPAAGAGQSSQPAAQLIITTDSAYYGVPVDGSYSLNLNIDGGQAPYAININWGDGSSDVISQTAAGRFSTTHRYGSAKTYYIVINASDAAGNKAYTQTTVLINPAGPAVIQPATSQTPPANNSLEHMVEIVWPLYVVIFLAVSAFWLGEKYQKRRIQDLWKSSHQL